MAATAGLTAGLAERAATRSFSDLPDDVADLARLRLLDWLGVTIAGSAGAGPTILRESLPRPADDEPDVATVIGDGRRLVTVHAALANGTASHWLDFDDVFSNFLGHPSVAVFGAAVALAERLDANADRLLTAFVAGYETVCRLTLALGPQPYVDGFHASGTISTFGAAAAGASLLDLGAEATTSALGIAASSAAGSKVNLGTMTKALHAGRAAEAGLLAAILASRGFSANPTAIEGPQGFAELSRGRCDLDAAFARPDHWYLRDAVYQFHAASFLSYSMIEGVVGLREQHALCAADIESIVVHISPGERWTCSIPAPTTGDEVKHSLTHLAALAVLGRDTTVIDDAAAADDAAVELRERVVLVDDGLPTRPTRVEVITNDGRHLRAAFDVTVPEPDRERQQRRVRDKFATLTASSLGVEAGNELATTVLALDPTTPVRAIVSLAVPSRSVPADE